MSGYYPKQIPYFYSPATYYQAVQAQRSAQSWQQTGQVQNVGQMQQTGQMQQVGQVQNAGQVQNTGQVQNAGQIQQTGQSQQTQPGIQFQGQHQSHSQQQPQIAYPTGATSAYAMFIAGPDYPSITGMVTFADIPGGVMVCADVQGLPPYKPASGEKSPVGPFGFHIHEKGMCEVGDPEKPFEGCGGHWNPTSQPHGNHAGDFPVLVAGNSGRAKMCFITDRFTVDEILGRSVMIHENPDDYRSQPAGNSGKRIACGSIKPWNSFQQFQ